jgi:imidazolonepropionase-like amidohydrolase
MTMIQNMTGFASAIHGFTLRHPFIGRMWSPPDTRDVGDAEVKRRARDVLDEIGDLSTWNSQTHKDFIAFAVESGAVTQAQVERVLARHGLTGLVTL